MKLKDVRINLKIWGEFWQDKRSGRGYGSNSVTGRLCETLRTGIYSIGTKYQVMDRADEINVPEHISKVDDALHSLTAAERAYIKLKYINKKNVDNYYVKMAENKLTGIL